MAAYFKYVVVLLAGVAAVFAADLPRDDDVPF